MTEAKFISLIDARFPYGDRKKGLALVALALKISPNAVFMIHHELAIPGRSVRAKKADRLAVLDYIDEHFVHPLSGLASWLTRKRISKEGISVAQAAAAARTIAKFPGCYNALNIACISCDDKIGENERLFDSITKKWEKKPIKIITAQRASRVAD